MGFPQLFIENLIIFGGVQYAWQFRNKAFQGSYNLTIFIMPICYNTLATYLYNNWSLEKYFRRKVEQHDIDQEITSGYNQLRVWRYQRPEIFGKTFTQGTITHVTDPSWAQSKPSTHPQNSRKHEMKLENEASLLFNALYNNLQTDALFQTT